MTWSPNDTSVPSICVSIGYAITSTRTNSMCIGHLLTSISQITSPNITHPSTTAECANTSSTPLLAQSFFRMHQLDVLRGGVLIPNRDSPNGYPTVRPAELQSVTLSHQVDTHKTLTMHKLACSCFVTPFGHQY